MKEKQPFAGEEEDVAEVLCAAQMKELLGEKSNSRMEGHLKDVKNQQKELFNMMKGAPSKVRPIPENIFSQFLLLKNDWLRLNRMLKRYRENFPRL